VKSICRNLTGMDGVSEMPLWKAHADIGDIVRGAEREGVGYIGPVLKSRPISGPLGPIPAHSGAGRCEGFALAR